MSRQYWEVDGRVVPPGKLVHTKDGWVEPAPVHCPNGHVFASVQATVGWVPCSTGKRVGHRTHQCSVCMGTVYYPPRDEDCNCQRIVGDR